MSTLATLPVLLLHRIPIRNIPILPPRIRNNSSTPTRPPSHPPDPTIQTIPIRTTTPQIQLPITLHKRPIQNLWHSKALLGAQPQLSREKVVEILATEFSGGFPGVAVKDGEIPTVGGGFVEIVEEGVRVFHRTSTFAVYVFGDTDYKSAVWERGGWTGGVGPMTGFAGPIVGVCVGGRRRGAAGGSRGDGVGGEGRVELMPREIVCCGCIQGRGMRTFLCSRGRSPRGGAGFRRRDGFVVLHLRGWRAGDLVEGFEAGVLRVLWVDDVCCGGRAAKQIDFLCERGEGRAPAFQDGGARRGGGRGRGRGRGGAAASTAGGVGGRGGGAVAGGGRGGVVVGVL
jgi:hypothetical protein